MAGDIDIYYYYFVSCMVSLSLTTFSFAQLYILYHCMVRVEKNNFIVTVICYGKSKNQKSSHSLFYIVDLTSLIIEGLLEIHRGDQDTYYTRMDTKDGYQGSWGRQQGSSVRVVSKGRHTEVGTVESILAIHL